MVVGDKAAAPLRARIAEVEAREARRHIDPLLRELEGAARQISASAREVERAAHAARRSRWERPLVMFALGALLAASALALAPESWMPGSAARRHRSLGQRLEHVWLTLDPREKEELRGLLGMAQGAENQK